MNFWFKKTYVKGILKILTICVEIREYFKIRSRTDKPFKVTSTSIKSSLVDEKFHGARHWAKLAFPIWGFEWCTLTHFWGDGSCVRWKTNRGFCTPPWKILQMEFSLFRSSKNTNWPSGSLAPQIHTINSLFQFRKPQKCHTGFQKVPRLVRFQLSSSETFLLGPCWCLISCDQAAQS